MFDARKQTRKRDGVGAVIATFEPGPLLVDTVAMLVRNDCSVLVVDDASLSHDSQQQLEKCRELGAQVVAKTVNSGIADSLNAGLAWADEQGYEYWLTLDQDTELPDDYLRVAISSLRDLEANNFKVGAVTAGRLNGSYRRPREPLSGSTYSRAMDVMQSGIVSRVAVSISLGGFRNGFVMDCVDTDYCLKLRQRGFLTVWLDDLEIQHQLGNSKRVRLLGRKLSLRGHPLFVSHHSELRRYYMTRNRLILLRQYGRIDREWGRKAIKDYLKETAFCVLFERHRLRKLSAIFSGLYDAARGREGKRGWA